MSNKISEMTESEFLSFVKKIYNAEYSSEEEHASAVIKFEDISEHPSGADLLYYPKPGKSGPDSVVEEIKSWRAANGKPGFKVV